MNTTENNNKSGSGSYRRKGIDERFEESAGVKILKGKEHYGGGSGFYSLNPKPECPNVNDGGHCNIQSTGK